MREQENNECEGSSGGEQREGVQQASYGTWEKAGDKSEEGIEESGR